MVSYAPDTQSLNYTYMYNFVQQLRNQGTMSICVEPGSIYGVLRSTPNFSKFLGIVDRARFASQLNSIQADFTVFVPTDDSLQDVPADFFKDMDIGLARQIVESCLMNRKIDKSLLTSSPVGYFMTLNPRMRMFVRNIGGKTILNDTATVISFDNDCTNGTIHVIDNLIIPTDQTFLN